MENEDLQFMREEDFSDRLTHGGMIQNTNLQGAVLSQTQAYDLTLKNCVFHNVDFTNVRWTGLRCTSVRFRNCDFHDADLEDAFFENCNFYDPDLPKESRGSQSIYPPGGCKFLRANLHSATFIDCDLSFCVFEGANVFHITIENSKATSAKFLRAQFNNSAKLINNKMHYADLRGARLAKCDISKTDFQWANLDEADFTEAILVGSNLSSATVRYAKFEKADLRGASIGSFDVRTIDLHGAKISESQMRQLLEKVGLAIFPDGR